MTMDAMAKPSRPNGAQFPIRFRLQCGRKAGDGSGREVVRDIVRLSSSSYMAFSLSVRRSSMDTAEDVPTDGRIAHMRSISERLEREAPREEGVRTDLEIGRVVRKSGWISRAYRLGRDILGIERVDDDDDGDDYGGLEGMRMRMRMGEDW